MRSSRLTVSAHTFIYRSKVKALDLRVQLIIDLMKSGLHRNLTLTELATSANLSLSYLHHLFKAETGTTPWLYLHSLRLEKAQVLLVNTMLSVKQIMNQVGIKDKSHFGRQFKKTYGKSPAQYRLSAKMERYLHSG
jgi:AraC family transcriptional regulator of adaptative response / methylphosphotriester-DNA alkyltransferase methyltransferase